MSSPDNWLVHEHSLYEDLLSRCQEAVEIEDWGDADLVFRELVAHLKRHMALEEEVLYSAYEAATEAPQGPTRALREEHDQIVRLVRDMVRVIKTRDSDYVLKRGRYLSAHGESHSGCPARGNLTATGQLRYEQVRQEVGYLNREKTGRGEPSSRSGFSCRPDQ